MRFTLANLPRTISKELTTSMFILHLQNFFSGLRAGLSASMETSNSKTLEILILMEKSRM
jgi:hypothetical protein